MKKAFIVEPQVDLSIVAMCDLWRRKVQRIPLGIHCPAYTIQTIMAPWARQAAIKAGPMIRRGEKTHAADPYHSA